MSFNECKNRLYKVSYACPFIVAFLIPVNQKLTTIAIMVWAFVSLITTKKAKLNLNPAYSLPILYYVILVFSILFSDNFRFYFFEHKLSFLVLPILFVLQAGRIVSKRKKVLYFFVYGCLFAVAICLMNSVGQSIAITEKGIAFSSKILDQHSLYNSVIYGGNHFFGTHFSILHQTVYFSLYLTMAILILLEIPFKNRSINVLTLLTLTISIFLVMNRASYLVLFLVSFIHIVFKIKSNKLKIGFISILTIFVFVLINNEPRVVRMANNIKVYLKSESKETNDNLINNIDRRLLLWSESLCLIKDNIVFGVGPTEVNNILNNRFKKKGLVVLKGLNAHNLYLQLLLEMGLLGLLLLCMMLYQIIKNIILSGYTKTFVMSFMALLTVNFLFESMFNRFSGIIFFVFFYCLFINFQKERKTVAINK